MERFLEIVLMSGTVSVKRHIAKTVTWRIIASGTTFFLALLFFGTDSQAVEKATGVALAETVLKMVFYYAHERTWYKFKWGVSTAPEATLRTETP